VREVEAGNVFKLDGFIGPITTCTTDPPCKYCGRSASGRPNHFEKPLTIEEVGVAARLMKEAGIRRVEIGGGTDPKGNCTVLINAVNAIKRTTDLDIWVNVGPSLSAEDLEILKELGVQQVCSSLESINPVVFDEAKPGDDLQARKKLAGEINASGLGLTSVMMVGLGSSYEDYVNHLFWLKEFGNLQHFCTTGFNPIPGTPYEDKTQATPFEVAKVGAVARLIFRTPDISFGGMMNEPRLLPFWIMAGANRAIHLGAHVHRTNSWHMNYANIEVERVGEIEFVNMLPLTTRIIKESGMEPDVV